MSVNKILLKDERRLTNTVKEQSRYIRELKTPQKGGADVVTVEGTGVTVVGPFTLVPTGTATIAFESLTTKGILTLWNFAFTLYIDPVSFDPISGVPDAQHSYPSGTGMTSTLLKTTGLQNWLDWANSNDATNDRVYVVRVLNNDSVNHTYWAVFNAYAPIGS